jgi:hypothetical protein
MGPSGYFSDRLAVGDRLEQVVLRVVRDGRGCGFRCSGHSSMHGCIRTKAASRLSSAALAKLGGVGPPFLLGRNHVTFLVLSRKAGTD